MFFGVLTSSSARGHQALAASVVLAYAVVVVASLRAHTERDRYHNITLRAVGLLRDAARSSLRADRGGDVSDVYADAARARIYVAAVDRLLTSAEVAKLTGVSLDELRTYVDLQLSEARASLADACGGGSSGAGNFRAFADAGARGYATADFPTHKKPTMACRRRRG